MSSNLSMTLFLLYIILSFFFLKNNMALILWHFREESAYNVIHINQIFLSIEWISHNTVVEEFSYASKCHRSLSINFLDKFHVHFMRNMRRSYEGVDDKKNVFEMQYMQHDIKYFLWRKILIIYFISYMC